MPKIQEVAVVVVVVGDNGGAVADIVAVDVVIVVVIIVVVVTDVVVSVVVAAFICILETIQGDILETELGDASIKSEARASLQAKLSWS